MKVEILAARQALPHDVKIFYVSAEELDPDSVTVLLPTLPTHVQASLSPYGLWLKGEVSCALHSFTRSNVEAPTLALQLDAMMISAEKARSDLLAYGSSLLAYSHVPQSRGVAVCIL